jgi:hypothetical protein
MSETRSGLIPGVWEDGATVLGLLLNTFKVNEVNERRVRERVERRAPSPGR